MSTHARKHFAKAIYFTTLLAAIAAFWQAVRFIQGDVGAPVFDQLIALANQIWGAENEDASTTLQMFSGYYFKAVYLIGGICTWFGVAAFALVAGQSLGRWIEVGFTKSTTSLTAAK